MKKNDDKEYFTTTTTQTDQVVEDVKYILDERSQKGQKEYGTTLEKNPAELKQWLLELQSELLDASLYIQKIVKIKE